MKKYKVVFLDWNGTLSDSKFWGHLGNPLHPNSHLFPKIEKTLFVELKHLLKPWMRGDIVSEEVISNISSTARLDYDVVFQDFVDSCKNMKLTTSKIIELIKQIQNSGTKVVIATDNMDSFPRWTVPSLNLNKAFDDILDSYTLKAIKGDFTETGESLFFGDYLKSNAILPHETVLIDDSEDKDNKITRYGIVYCRLNDISNLEGTLTDLLK